MNSSAHIRVSGVTHQFNMGRSQLKALSHVNLDVWEGEFVSILGPSGSGKTTLLKIIGGLLEPTSGSVLIDGAEASESQRNKSIGFVFQEGNLLPWRSVIQNIKLPLEINLQGNAANYADAERILDTVGLKDFRDYYPHQLSGGMKQRLALARALVLNPSILLMDEPLGSLDEFTRSEIRYEILRLWEQSRKTVVFVTHSISEAIILSDRIAVMSNRPGRIIAELKVDLPRPRHESVELSNEFRQYVYDLKKSLSLAA